MSLSLENVKTLLLGYGSALTFEGMRGASYVIEWRMMGMLLSISSIPNTTDFSTYIIRVRDGKQIDTFNMWLSRTFKERYRLVWGDVLNIDENYDEVEKMLGLVFNLTGEANSYRQLQAEQMRRHTAYPKSFPMQQQTSEPKA